MGKRAREQGKIDLLLRFFHEDGDIEGKFGRIWGEKEEVVDQRV